MQDRGWVDLPVACMQHSAAGCPDDQRIRFRERMRHCGEFDIERPDIEATAQRDNIDRNLRRSRLARALRLEQRGRKGRGVNGKLQPWPKIKQCAEMIL